MRLETEETLWGQPHLPKEAHCSKQTGFVLQQLNLHQRHMTQLNFSVKYNFSIT
jgi:hypothetical protein